MARLFRAHRRVCLMEMSRRVRHCVEMIPMLHVVEVRCGVRDVIGTIMQDLVEVSCCVRHSVEVIAVLHIVVCVVECGTECMCTCALAGADNNMATKRRKEELLHLAFSLKTEHQQLQYFDYVGRPSRSSLLHPFLQLCGAPTVIDDEKISYTHPISQKSKLFLKRRRTERSVSITSKDPASCGDMMF